MRLLSRPSPWSLGGRRTDYRLVAIAILATIFAAWFAVKSVQAALAYKEEINATQNHR